MTTEVGDQQDVCNLTSTQCAPRSLYLNEVTNNFGSTDVEVPKRSCDGRTTDMLERRVHTCGKAAGTRAQMRSRTRRKSISYRKIRRYSALFAEALHLEYKLWIDNEVSDLLDMRKAKTRNYVTRRWVLTIKTARQGNLLKAKARLVLSWFQDKQKEYQQM